MTATLVLSVVYYY